MEIRKATIHDVEQMQPLIQHYADQGLMLPRSAKSLYEHIQCFTVAVIDERVVGTVGLHILWKDLAEVRSLAVDPGYQGRGIGRRLVERAIWEAEQLGVDQVLSLTYQTDFFHKLNFHIVDRDSLPHKVWKDCVYCKKFDRCDEIAMVYYTQSFKKVHAPVASIL
ncbi:N-acetyltransferase [Alicyclobacillus sp.]|uniref:N-acetyltransferase n=1 Tax=Alicyclobacillus sp. TaxID=61169 RepID=UPI0025BE330C|nr:N-acetyltransferase [Alicyclobacillus sp.]MCL6517511.1 N-acetyltransferase [Alicyclobacillus sp.]